MGDWTTDFFKGRIGEAVVESTLLKFGYKVERMGCEARPGYITDNPEDINYSPDLLVTDPENKKTYLEVKLHSSHPLKVKISKVKVESLKQVYPDTLLVFVSSFNGSINCLGINDPVLNDDKLDKEGFYQVDLLAKDWKPLWDFFPMVAKGERTDLLWQDMKAVLDDFAGNRLTRSRDTGFFAEEKESLKKYIEKHWHPGMMAQDINSMNLDIAELEDIWQHALTIHAFRFAFEMCGDENLDHPAFNQIMDKVLGRIGDRFITIPYQDIKDALGTHPELFARLQVLEDEVSRTSPYDAGVVMMQGLLEIIPPGIGTAYVLPEKGSREKPLEVDFHTVLALLQRRNCLYD